ncbi:hypothetical protein ACFYSI_06950 [Staphylococcus xylosus]|uniref:hypothetical protein n=1 Tax=Staphylococcus xylosus TaxID=1288 RepID=UPI0036B370CE
MKFGKYKTNKAYFILALSFLALSATMPLLLAASATFLFLGLKQEENKYKERSK